MSHTPSPSERRAFLAGLDPVALVELLDSKFTDLNASEYRRTYQEARQRFLEADGQEAVHFAALLDELDAAARVEDATRHAGFILGFETCRQLLLGELDFEALAREEAE